MAAKKRAKKAVRKTGRKTGVLVPQKHGGALLNGMAPNHVPGPGRPPSEVKARALGSFDNRLSVLEEIADDGAASNADRISAVDKLGKYGFADGVSRAEVRKALHATLTAIRDALSADVADGLLAAIKPHWSQL